MFGNQLRPEDIDKIIGTYQFRTEEARYSRRVGMEEIEQNDFNLNISRYVSTAEAEDEIDLASVHAELVSLEQKRKAALDKHNEFLQELGLRTATTDFSTRPRRHGPAGRRGSWSGPVVRRRRW